MRHFKLTAMALMAACVLSVIAQAAETTVRRSSGTAVRRSSTGKPSTSRTSTTRRPAEGVRMSGESGRSSSSGGRLTAHATKRSATRRQADDPPADEELTPPTPPQPSADSAFSDDGAVYEESPAVGAGCGPGGCSSGDCFSGAMAGGCCDTEGACPAPMMMGGNCNRGHLWAAAEAVFVKPYFEMNPALVTTFSDGLNVTQDTTSFNYSQNVAPRLWFGYESSCGLGARTRYFQWDSRSQVVQATSTGVAESIAAPFILPPNGTQFAPATAGGNESWTVSSRLQVQSIDLEGTKTGQFGCWSLLGAAGIRYAKVHQEYDGTLLNANGLTSSTVAYNQGKEGIGPSFAMEARRPLGCRFQLYSSARTSFLVGNSVSTLAAREELDTTVPQPTTARMTGNGPMTISELQVGAEWNSNFGLLSGKFFFRGVFEAQAWTNVGSATSSKGDLVFLGGSVLAGLRY